ncbi:MAG: RagB/SusD family nutrient uptake outer membrane protein [Bacteroidales bacterium]|nr:RagB/SusD family nutrient uptake outer membrane protein [Bacteroidales bacterium]
MKTINHKLIIISSILILFYGCKEELLDTHPYNLQVVGNFYKTPDDAQKALVATYSVLNWGYYDHMIVVSEVMSDNCYGGCGAADDMRYQVWDDFDYHGFYNPSDLLWQRYWYGIYRANVLLQNIDKIDWKAAPEKKNQVIAEARFLRAHFYFDVVRLYGNVPLLDKPVDPNQMNVPQAEPEEVYKLIAQDLKFAIENLPNEKYSASFAKTNGGRATKWAAEALMGRVFLFYTGYYNKPDIAGIVTKNDVQEYLEDVIQNSGHKLLSKYSDLWLYSPTYAGECNDEVVFAIKYTYKGYGDLKQQNGAQWQIMVGIRAQKHPEYHYPFGEGWGAATVDPRLYNSYEAGDTRRDASIICWDSMKLAEPLDISDMREFTGFTWKKYCPLETPNGIRLVESMGGNYINDNFEDYADIRFADVLLMAAEIFLDTDLGKAQNYYNMVRNRAFNGNPPPKNLTNDQNGKNLIFEERRHELALEGQRYWDLLRYDGINGNFSYAKNNIETLTPFEQFFRPETKGLLPIPWGQINLMNGALKQNEGWNID